MKQFLKSKKFDRKIRIEQIKKEQEIIDYVIIYILENRKKKFF